MATPFITIKNISKIFPRKEGRRALHVLDDVNLTIHKGEFCVLLGPSGCGKSTLLRLITGLEEKTHGDIIFHEKFDLDKIGFVFQNFGLLSWLTVEENVELGLIGRNVPVPERKQKVKKILEHFGLSQFEKHRPFELSGGMKQRVGLARAFVTEPDIIFLDEPFSELDFFTAESLRRALLDLWKTRGATIVMVSHYLEEAVELSDRIAIFKDRPGTILQIVKNELPRPRDHRSPAFFALEDEVIKILKN
ncbi:MAG TPA: ABC transporter ATP-binding protein [Candidatus Paceibacterota bacterium]|jgi:NitT/TauT family transport system ATP-binding protein|nr:ABC transporter ATP-binding protein [Candidatus Paceibacterota bacterium]